MILIICCLKKKRFFLASEYILICYVEQTGNTQDTLKLIPPSCSSSIINVRHYSPTLNAYLINDRKDREYLTNTTNGK